MKKLAIAVTALVVVGMAPTIAEDKPDKPVVEEKVLLVQGDKEWTDTGLTLGAGDDVRVKATGKVCFNAIQPESCVEPDGWPRSTYKDDWPGDHAYCFDPYESAGHAALIGGVENRNFAVGASARFTGKDGRLYLGINDCSLTGEEYPNSRKYSVTITVTRKRVPRP